MRLGAVKVAMIVTLVSCAASLGLVLIAMATVMPVPAEALPVVFLITIGVPLVIAAPVAWYLGHLMIEAEEARRAAERMAVIDPLTQAFNRRHFFHFGERAFARARTDGLPLSVLLLDLDHFKAVNDHHGHAAGDRVLIRVAQVCTAGMRKRDLLARFGGEEFVALLPDTGAAEAGDLAERLRATVENAAATGMHAADIRPTVSIGVATATPATRSLDALLAAADAARYEAKRAGRNRIAIGALAA